jgi:Peptidase family C25
MVNGFLKIGARLGLLLGLGGYALGVNHPQFFPREVPQELQGSNPKLQLTKPAQVVPFSLGEVQFRELKNGGYELFVEESRPLVVSGQPKVPQILRVLKLEKGQEAQVRLSHVVLEETISSVPLAKAPQAFVWGHGDELNFRSPSLGRYFPGKLVQSYQHGGALYVSLFPLQVDLLTGKILKMTSANIEVLVTSEGRFSAIGVRTARVGPPATEASLIVVPSQLGKAAELLKSYHEQLGVKTQVVTVEEIDKLQTPIAEEDLPNGYKQKEYRDDYVKPYQAVKKTGYHYELARKISQYLQSRMGEGSSLKYVTLLGNSDLVPPSYYFSYSSTIGKNFTPTDACYGAIKKCGEPKVAVGRLPFTQESEVKSYIDKVEVWRSFAANSSQELSLLGGKAFPRSNIYVGELGTLNAIQNNKLDWRGVKKKFKTQKNYSKAIMMDIVRGQAETPFSYHLDHGGGNRWFAETESISTKEVEEVSSDKPITPTLMVSISCTNAAFDESLTKESVLGEDSDGLTSVGTQLVRSRTGTVAYLGSARPAMGMPIYQIDEFGNLELTGSNYGLQILEGFFQKYGFARRGRLGDFSLKALQAFVFENGNDMKIDDNAWSYFITELLGDPVIPLPDRKGREDNFELGKSLLKLDNSTGFGFPVLHSKKTPVDSFPLSIAQSVEASLYRVIKDEDSSRYTGEELVTSQKINPDQNPKFELGSQNKLTSGDYFMRIENTVGVPRERQLYFSVE